MPRGVQLRPLLRTGFRYQPGVALEDPSARQALLLMAPRALGMGASQITFVVAVKSGLIVGYGHLTPEPSISQSAPTVKKFDSAPEFGIDTSKRYSATIEVTHGGKPLGTVVVALDAINAPNTVNNFVFLAGYHYYDGIIFHRIINGFMCQGGDPTGTGTGGPGYKFNDEPVKQRYQLGSLAMANAGPNTNGSQFFLISGASGVGLPPQYNHFGQTVKGLEVIDAMQRVETARGDRPREDVVIQSVTIAVAD